MKKLILIANYIDFLKENLFNYNLLNIDRTKLRELINRFEKEY